VKRGKEDSAIARSRECGKAKAIDNVDTNTSKTIEVWVGRWLGCKGNGRPKAPRSESQSASPARILDSVNEGGRKAPCKKVYMDRA